jgi:hypothetical protein
MSTRTLRKGIAASVLSAGALVGLSGGSAIAAPTHHSFGLAQQQLESQLALRVTGLGRLAADVTGAATILTPTHATLLSTRIAAEQADINALVVKVPTDTTFAQLNADRTSMYKDNRVFAVMTPQVFETINADSALAQLATLQKNEASLATEVSSLTGQPGYENAVDHLNNYLTRVGHETTTLSNLEVTILAQQPSGYPGNQHFFAHANRTILQAEVQIAYANYDASVIALATGGYTGS